MDINLLSLCNGFGIMTLKENKNNSVVSIHVVGRHHIICIKWKVYEIKVENPSKTEGTISYHHPRYFLKDMVDCLSKAGHPTKRKNFVIQHHHNYYSDLKSDSENSCVKSQNNIMQKRQQGVEPSSNKQNDLSSSSSVEHSCIEKTEKPQNVWQRRDSFSSCSSDSAVYCSTRHTQVSVPEEPVRMLSCENTHIDMTCESKRQRHSSGSSVISIASDASCKEPQSGSLRKNTMSCISASPKFCETDATDVSENVIQGNHVNKTKPTLISISRPKQEIIHEVTSPTGMQKKMSHSPPLVVRHHDLRKNIRRKACCHGDCNETHTTFIVRRYPDVHSNAAQHHSSNTSSGKRNAPSSSASNSSVDSSPNSNKKRKSEIDKLFAALHEIKWAKHFSPETILQQTEARRTASANKLLSSTDSSSVSPTSSLNKNRIILKSRSPTKNDAIVKNKVSSEKDDKPKESFTVRRPSIHFLNTKSQQYHNVNNASPPETAHRGSWLSTKKKLSEKHALRRKSSEVVFNDSVGSGRQDYAEMSDVEDNLGVAENDFTDMKCKHSPIFLQVVRTTEGNYSSPKGRSHVHELGNKNKSVSDSHLSPKSSSIEQISDSSGILCPNAQSAAAVIRAKDNTAASLQILPVSKSQDCSKYPLQLPVLDANSSKTETVNNSDFTPLISSSRTSNKFSDLEPCEKLRNVSLEVIQSRESLIEDQPCCESKVSNTEKRSCHNNEPLDLPLLSSEDSPVKDAPFSETPPVLEPCILLPAQKHKESPPPPPPESPCASHASNHLSQNETTGHESDSERSCASLPDVLFVSPVKKHKTLEQKLKLRVSSVRKDQQEKQEIATTAAADFSPGSCRNRSESKTACDVSSMKRASRLILKKYVKNSNRKGKNHKHRDLSWDDDNGKVWNCVMVEGDQDRDSDEENQLSELLNHKITSSVSLTKTVNSSGSENNNYNSDLRTRTSSKGNFEYHKESVCDGALSTHSNKSQGRVSSGSYVVHLKKVPQTSANVSTSRNPAPFQVPQRKHNKSGKTWHLKEKLNCKKPKKTTAAAAAIGETTNGNKNLSDEKRELPQEVIKLRMLYGFTFHYKGITVNKNDSYTQVILKLTTSRSIFLSVEALMELKDTLNSAGNDSNCQVLIINGIGNSFCSGLDLRPLIGPRKKDAAKEMAVAVKEFIEALASFHKPLVSVVNGTAVGLGVTLLTYSDVVLASDTASFHMPYAQLGYMPEGAVTLTLPHVMGSTVAMDMLLRGRKITARQACDHGLVSEVLEAKKLPQQLVSRVRILAESPVSAMESTKSMLRWHLYGKLHVALENEVQMLPKQWLSPTCQLALQNAFDNGFLSE